MCLSLLVENCVSAALRKATLWHVFLLFLSFFPFPLPFSFFLCRNCLRDRRHTRVTLLMRCQQKCCQQLVAQHARSVYIKIHQWAQQQVHLFSCTCLQLVFFKYELKIDFIEYFLYSWKCLHSKSEFYNIYIHYFHNKLSSYTTCTYYLDHYCIQLISSQANWQNWQTFWLVCFCFYSASASEKNFRKKQAKIDFRMLSIYYIQKRVYVYYTFVCIHYKKFTATTFCLLS